MSKKVKKGKVKTPDTSRRSFLKKAAVAGAAAGAASFGTFLRTSAAEKITLKMQTAWDAGTLGYVKFMDWVKTVPEITEGKLVIEGFPAGAIVGTFEMFDAVKAGVFDAYHSFDVYWPGKIPVATGLRTSGATDSRIHRRPAPPASRPEGGAPGRATPPPRRIHPPRR